MTITLVQMEVTFVQHNSICIILCIILDLYIYMYACLYTYNYTYRMSFRISTHLLSYRALHFKVVKNRKCWNLPIFGKIMFWTSMEYC